MGTDSGARVEAVEISAYAVPTDGPDGEEADGTLVWSATTLVLVQLRSEGAVGLGYTYGDASTAGLIDSKLRSLVEGQDPFRVRALWLEQMAALRNLGRTGLSALALSAVDIALWDLRAKLLGLPLAASLGPYRDSVPIYGSGGFCNYPIGRLVSQAQGWVREGIPRVKIKTSRHPHEDPDRLDACRAAIGDEPELMVDANGGLGRKRALYWAHRFRDEWGVTWMEEPVSADDREGLRLIRDGGPPGLDVAAGEYGFVLRDFVDLLQSQSVDCLQADVTRCGGITGLLRVAGLCASHEIELSAHCAPAISAHAFCAAEKLRHLEYFHDHVRLESMLFEGTLQPTGGHLAPEPTRPGLGIQLKRRDAERYLVYGSP